MRNTRHNIFLAKNFSFSTIDWSKWWQSGVKYFSKFQEHFSPRHPLYYTGNRSEHAPLDRNFDRTLWFLCSLSSVHFFRIKLLLSTRMKKKRTSGPNSEKNIAGNTAAIHWKFRTIRGDLVLTFLDHLRYVNHFQYWTTAVNSKLQEWQKVAGHKVAMNCKSQIVQVELWWILSTLLIQHFTNTALY